MSEKDVHDYTAYVSQDFGNCTVCGEPIDGANISSYTPDPQTGYGRFKHLRHTLERK